MKPSTRDAFRLPTPVNDAVPDDESCVKTERRMSTALIIHPLSMYSPDKTQKYTPEWYLAALAFQQHEMEQLKQQQPTVLQPSRRLCLLDYTCDDNVRTILSFLDGATLCMTRRVCRYFNELAENDELWLHLCKAEWALSPDQLRERPASYQALYKYACQSLRRMIREFFEEQCLSSLQNSFRIPRDTAISIARRSFEPY
ncbi:hypothetical protein Poli38472_012847 [Pythium oligandrum]|uniref:F-box domain-containing protein n=1 Tax=Pythium oligandrum TaxID=41045 RepID=A0A8K1CJ73_PYTOL|nr:hypothetical protein Poli38472_012847 [Pythium oligandrum]|eukprot:TMW64225.1 hypothetical protein Poli38472_012847 [Pythium oligandrum]